MAAGKALGLPRRLDSDRRQRLLLLFEELASEEAVPIGGKTAGDHTQRRGVLAPRRSDVVAAHGGKANISGDWLDGGYSA